MVSLPGKKEAEIRDLWPIAPMIGDACWWVLRTRSRQEKAVASTLESMEIPHFFPTVSAERYVGHRKYTVTLPLFPGYVFLHGDRDSTYRIDRTNRVASILTVEDQEQLHRELCGLKKAIQFEACFDPYPYLPQGAWAEVKSGPYKGLQGKVDRSSRSNKLILQVDILQTAMALELDGAVLSPL